MDFDKAGNAEDLDNKKLQLICNAYNRRLLSSQRVVDGINSMDYSKLKILCKYNNKFSYKGIEELLSDESIANNIKDYNDEMLRSMLNDAPSEHNILEILKGGEVCNTNNEFESSDDEGNEEDYGYYDNSDYEEDEKNDPNNCTIEALGNKETNEKCVDDVQFYNDAGVEIPPENQNAIRNIRLRMMVEKYGKLSDQNVTELLKDQSSIDRINSLGDKKLQLILNSNKFSGEDIMELLGNQKVVEYLNFIDYEKFELIHNSDKFNSSKYASSSHKIIRLLENQKIVKHINFIDYEKLQFILCHNKFLLSDIIRLLKNQEVVENIISFNIEKFRLIFYSDELNCIDIIELLENQEVVERINSMNHKNFQLISSKFYGTSIIRLLENQSAVRNIDLIDEETFQYIVKNNDFRDIDIIKLLEDQEVVNGIGFTPLEELKSICSHSRLSDIIRLLKDKNGPSSVLSGARKEETSCIHDMA